MEKQILKENVKEKRRLSQKMNKSLLISFNECLARNLNSSNSHRTGEQSTLLTTITSLPIACLDTETGTNTLINIENASQFQQIINERKCKCFYFLIGSCYFLFEIYLFYQLVANQSICLIN